MLLSFDSMKPDRLAIGIAITALSFIQSISVNAQDYRLVELHYKTGVMLSSAELDSLGAFRSHSGSCAYILLDKKDNILVIFNRHDTVRINLQMLRELYLKAEAMSPALTTPQEAQQCTPENIYPIIQARELWKIADKKREKEYMILSEPEAVRVQFTLGSGIAFCRREVSFGLNTGLTFRNERGLLTINASNYRKQEEFPVKIIFWGGNERRTVLNIKSYDLAWGKSFNGIDHSIELAVGPTLQIVETHEYKVVDTPPFWFFGGPEVVETSYNRYKHPGINGMARLHLFPRRGIGLSLSLATTVTKIHSSVRLNLAWRIGRLYRVTLKNN